MKTKYDYLLETYKDYECAQIHVVPDYETASHIDDQSCQCKPVLEVTDPENGNEVWSHNSIDYTVN